MGENSLRGGLHRKENDATRVVSQPNDARKSAAPTRSRAAARSKGKKKDLPPHHSREGGQLDSRRNKERARSKSKRSHHRKDGKHRHRKRNADPSPAKRGRVSSDSSSSHSFSSFRKVRSRLAPMLGEDCDRSDSKALEALANEMFSSSRGRSKFTHFTRSQFRQAGRLFTSRVLLLGMPSLSCVAKLVAFLRMTLGRTVAQLFSSRLSVTFSHITKPIGEGPKLRRVSRLRTRKKLSVEK